MPPFKASDNGGGPSPITTAELPGPQLSPKAACQLRARNVVQQSPHLRWLATLAILRDTAPRLHAALHHDLHYPNRPP